MAWLEDIPLYVQVYKNRILAHSNKQEVRVEKTGNFSHPRMLVGHFAAAESLLRLAFKEIGYSSFLSARPRLIMHPKELLEGGLTEVEVRVFQEIALGAGGRQAVVWQGPDLDRNQLKQFPFPKVGVRTIQALTPGDLPG